MILFIMAVLALAIAVLHIVRLALRDARYVSCAAAVGATLLRGFPCTCCCGSSCFALKRRVCAANGSLIDLVARGRRRQKEDLLRHDRFPP